MGRGWIDKNPDAIVYDEEVEEEDSDALEEMEKFEKKYNFRHEEE